MSFSFVPKQIRLQSLLHLYKLDMLSPVLPATHMFQHIAIICMICITSSFNFNNWSLYFDFFLQNLGVDRIFSTS